jgi:predicted transposase/invertase (TIGR01784 family)
VLFPQVPDYHLRFQLLEESHHFPFAQDMEFHILELPKFTKSVSQLESGLDIWLYFLCHAEKMDTEALPGALQQPLVVRAMEELKMLTQTDLERERYEARRKWQLDYNTGLKVARMEGHEEGREKGLEEGREKGREEGREEGLQRGEKIGTIHLCERLLQRSETPTPQLAQLSLEDLTRLAEDLQTQVLQR